MNHLALSTFWVVLPLQVNRYRSKAVAKEFTVGDHVSWNSEAGQVSGIIIKVQTADIDYKGHVHHVTRDNPQYEIRSDKTDHIAMHKGSALRLIRD
jgi:hypothetical protein